MATNTVEFANQLLAENENLKQRIIALESDAKLSTETLKNADKVVLAAKDKFEQICADNDALQKQVRALTAQWVFVSESGNPSVPAGERAEFWVCHADKDGQHSVTKLTWFNHVEPHEDDQDAIDCCEMSTPDGESFWPFGWHEEFSSHDFEHFYEPSRLKVVAYAPFTAPGVPLSIHAGEQP